MIDFGKITFSREYDNGEYVTHSIGGESSLPDVIDAFSYFLKGCGYYIPEGEYLDFAPEPDVSEDFDPKPKNKLWDATPQEWNNAYQNVTVKYK